MTVLHRYDAHPFMRRGGSRTGSAAADYRLDRWEAGAIAGFPAQQLFLLGALGLRGLGMLVCILRVLLGLVRMLLALGVVVAVVSRGCGAMRLCRGFVMFRCLVVCVFHVEFSCWPKNLGGLQEAPQ
jgi:hypothetical protein